MKILLDNDLNELQQLMLDLNEPKFRAKQLYDSLLLGQNVDENTTLPKLLKEKLSDYIWQPIKIYKTYEGKVIQAGFTGRNNTTSIQSYEFEFSITDKDIADSLMRCGGREVELHYKEYLGALPWRGMQKYIVDDIIAVKE